MPRAIGASYMYFGARKRHLQEALEELVCVVDPLCILSDDPDHGRARLGLVQAVQAVAQRGDDGLISANTSC